MIKIKIFGKLQERMNLLTEVSYEDALKTLESEKFKKELYNTVYSVYSKRTQVNVSKEYLDAQIKDTMDMLVHQIKLAIPNDIEDSAKGLSINWLKRKYLDYYKSRTGGYSSMTVRQLLERYFQYNGKPSFIQPPEAKDLNKIESFDTLKAIVDDAKPRYEAYLEKKAYLDADKGTEKIIDTGEWEVFIPHNKGAACKLGKGTDWCTAAPGLDYYEQYHKKYNPLFIFINKNNEQEKYQFNYGSQQFMDKDDKHMRLNKILELHHLLLSRDIQENYPIIDKINIRALEKAEKTAQYQEFFSKIEMYPIENSIKYNDKSSAKMNFESHGEQSWDGNHYLKYEMRFYITNNKKASEEIDFDIFEIEDKLKNNIYDHYLSDIRTSIDNVKLEVNVTDAIIVINGKIGGSMEEIKRGNDFLMKEITKFKSKKSELVDGVLKVFDALV